VTATTPRPVWSVIPDRLPKPHGACSNPSCYKPATCMLTRPDAYRPRPACDSCARHLCGAAS
jgi:hypothetical protein